MERLIPDYIRACELHRVIDGDTVELVIDLGFRRATRERVRLKGIDAPERHTSTRAAGDAAALFVEDWFQAVDHPILVSHQADSFGRWLGSIYDLGPDGTLVNSLADALLENGHAVVYSQR